LIQDLKFTNHAQQKFSTSNEVNTRFDTIVKEFDMKLTVKLDKAKFEEKVLELEKMIEKSGKKAANQASKAAEIAQSSRTAVNDNNK